MKTKYILLFIIIISVVQRGRAQSFQVPQTEYINLFERYHYSPKKINDAFSNDLFNIHIEYLDSRKHFFLKNDIEILKSQYYNELDDIESNNANDFNKSALKILNKRILNANKIVKNVLSSPIDFNQADTLQLDVTQLDFPKDEIELKKRWNGLIKYQVLQEYLQLKKVNKNLTDEKSLKRAVKQIFANYHFQFQRFRSLEKKAVDAALINSIAKCYDPHSYNTKPYFKIDESLNSVNPEKITDLGLGLSIEKGFPTIVYLKIGGPAWASEEIEEGDILLKIGEEGKQEYDVLGLWLHEVYSLMYGVEDTKVNLTIKKIDGTLKKVTITRRKSEGNTTAAILSINKVNTAYAAIIPSKMVFPNTP